MKHSHLLVLLDAPLLSFGSEAVDAHGIVRDFPSCSALTGLLANALGWERHEVTLLDDLQDQLTFAAALLEEGVRVKDFQTAKLAADDRGWTTRGVPEGRGGSLGTYQSPHLRHRYADAGTRALVALRLLRPDREINLGQLARALDWPERPLFIGRKSFVPSTRLLHGMVEATSAVQALGMGIAHFGKVQTRAQWPIAEGPSQGSTMVELTDQRNWRTGVHAGLRRVWEGAINAEFGTL